MRMLFNFLKQISPHISKGENNIETKRTKVNKGGSFILDKISGLAIVKLLDKLTQGVMVIAILDIMNNSLEILILNPKETLGILDCRLLGYYKIKQGVLQQNIGKYYEFESAEKVCA